MVHSKFTALVAGLGLAALLAGCESAQSEKDMIMEAQYCLDKATASNVDSCLGGISSLTSTNAYSIRCSAGFLKSGVTTAENMAEAVTAIQNSGGAATMLSILNFDGSTSLANWTADQCSQSGSSGLALLGAMAKSATALASAVADFPSCSTAGGTITCDEAQMDQLLADMEAALNSGTPGQAYDTAIETVTAVVESVQAVYAVSCGTANANKDLCGPIDDALASANLTPADLAGLSQAEIKDLGTKLLAQWQQ
jgi:hypothetical protein